MPATSAPAGFRVVGHRDRARTRSPVAVEHRRDLRRRVRTALMPMRKPALRAAVRPRRGLQARRSSATGRPRRRLEQVAAKDRRVVRRATRHDHDPDRPRAAPRSARAVRPAGECAQDLRLRPPCPPLMRAPSARHVVADLLAELDLVAIAAVERHRVVLTGTPSPSRATRAGSATQAARRPRPAAVRPRPRSLTATHALLSPACSHTPKRVTEHVEERRACANSTCSIPSKRAQREIHLLDRHRLARRRCARGRCRKISVAAASSSAAASEAVRPRSSRARARSSRARWPRATHVLGERAERYRPGRRAARRRRSRGRAAGRRALPRQPLDLVAHGHAASP